MVDILDMEDIIFDIIIGRKPSKDLVKKIILEVADFVDNQQNIACNNCKGKKFKDLKERWQVG